MLRFALSLVAASFIAFAGYSALGTAAHAAPQGGLKVIAVVVAHAGHRSTVSSASQEKPSVVQ